MCRARRPAACSPCAMRGANPGTTPCKQACCSTDREHGARAHDRYDMRDGYAATGGTCAPIRFPVCFDVVTCRRCDRRSGQFRLQRRPRVNRKARAMRRKPKRGKRYRQTCTVTWGKNRRKCFRNVSVFGRPGRNQAKTRDSPRRTSRSQRLPNKAARPSAHARGRPDQSSTGEYFEKALQKCDLAQGASDADAQSCVTRQGEYRCVRMQLVHVTPGSDTRAGTTAASRSADRPRRRRSEKGRMVINIGTRDDRHASAVARTCSSAPSYNPYPPDTFNCCPVM